MRLAAALATRKVTVDAVRKGMNMAKVFSDPRTFLDGHLDSLPAAAPVRSEVA